MAKKTKEVIEVLDLEYDLHSLPTAQHKAGLAGLVMLVRWLGPENKQLLTVQHTVSAEGATFSLTADSLKVVFDQLYAGRKAQVTSSSKWAGTQPLDEIMIEVLDKTSGKPKSEKRFLYEVVQPRFDMLADYFSDDSLWLGLWRDMCWATTRAVPKTRLPYEKSAAGASSGVAEDEWLQLTKEYFARQNGRDYTAPIAGSIFIGAQATNAENLAFEGFPRENLLLHFWVLSILVFCPRALNKDGFVESRGFLLAFPEVNDLEDFIDAYPTLAAELTKDSRKVGRRPSGSLLDIAAESALQFTNSLARVAQAKGKGFSSVSSIEYCHLEKQGNSVKGLEFGKVFVDESLLYDYRDIFENNRFFSFLFRRGLIEALLDSKAWYVPFRNPMQDLADGLFLQTVGGGPKGSKEGEKFANDCRKKFQQLKKLEKERQGRVASKLEPMIETIVYRLVERYLRVKSLEATNEKWAEFPSGEKGNKKPSKRFLEYRAKLGRSLFLELRSRREAQFIEHFSATFGAVGQFIPRKDFIVLTRCLRDLPEDVKVLTLLSLSAHSYHQEEL